jgi:hypothetical protein
VLARPGVTLHLSGRDATRLESVAALCRMRGATVHPRILDVRDAERAARIILRGVAAGRVRVAFPWWIALAARLVGLLPPRLLGVLLARLPGKASDPTLTS